MSKMITSRELALIVSGLLTHPERLGEEMTPEKYQHFMEAIANVVADHCGGQAGTAAAPITGAMGLPAPRPPASDDDAWMVAIYPTDSLPDVNRNVWALGDPEGWADEDGYNDLQAVAAHEEASATATALIRSLVPPPVVVVSASDDDYGVTEVSSDTPIRCVAVRVLSDDNARLIEDDGPTPGTTEVDVDGCSSLAAVMDVQIGEIDPMYIELLESANNEHQTKAVDCTGGPRVG